MTAEWHASEVKAQFRLASQRLAQLQQKKDSQSAAVWADMATLLRQGNIALARAKAQNLLLEDAKADLMGTLEMYLGTLMERVNEIDQRNLSTAVVEAASSVIYAAPHLDSTELASARESLVQRLGQDFTRSAIRNTDNRVPRSVLSQVSAPPPSALVLDNYLLKVARSNGVNWTPGPQRQDALTPLAEMLDPQTTVPVDLERLRALCAKGVPDGPSYLRPRIWKLLYSTLPMAKTHWAQDNSRQRDSYYDLVRRLLAPLQDQPPPSDPPSPSDVMLLNVYQKLSRIPSHILMQHLSEESETNVYSPLDTNAPEGIRVKCSDALDRRLALLRQEDGNSPTPRASSTPEIRLESESTDSYFSNTTAQSSSQRATKRRSTTLVASHAIQTLKSHHKHTSSLFRLLFVHCSINPGNFSPHVSSLLAILYYVCIQETAPEDLSHAEADTFWLFEAMIGEFSEVEDEEGGSVWMKRLSSRLEWADPELHESLRVKGLDPALPHYSYRWLAPILTQTLPLPDVLLVWDVLFTRPMRERDYNFKLDALLDICTALLIRVRTTLQRAGKPKAPSSQKGLWNEENVRPPSPLKTWEFGDAFLEAMSTLESYPLRDAGGIDRVLQTAFDLSYRRHVETNASRNQASTLVERIRVSAWRGFTNQVSSPLPSPAAASDRESSADEGNDTETPTDEPKGISSRFATTFLRGITNQSSMEVPPTPISPIPLSQQQSILLTPTSPSPLPLLPVSRSPTPSPPPSASTTGSFWSYADKLRDSDTAAQLAKVSTNLRAKSIFGSFGVPARPNAPPSPASSEPPPFAEQDMRPIPLGAPDRRGSLPVALTSSIYSPPPRPTVFRAPRDSVVPTGYHYQQASEPSQSTIRGGSFLDRTRAALGASPNAPKSGPRPLLLGSSSVVTSPPQPPPPHHQRRESSYSSLSHQPEHQKSYSSTSQRSEHQRHDSSFSAGYGRSRPRDSMSSTSSTLESPGQLLRPDWDSDGGSRSRKVMLNRRSVSPMAPAFRLPPEQRRTGSYSGDSDRGFGSPIRTSLRLEVHSNGRASPAGSQSSGRGWSMVDTPESPTMSSPPPETPNLPRASNETVMVTNGGQHNSEAASDAVIVDASDFTRPKFPPSPGSDSSASDAPARAQRSWSKRRQNRPADIQTTSPVDEFGQKYSASVALTVDQPPIDLSTTPTAPNFADKENMKAPSVSPRRRKVSTERRPQRKTSTESRQRKISSSSREIPIRNTESAAEEGDDEGYDDLLSAYESEVDYTHRS